MKRKWIGVWAVLAAFCVSGVAADRAAIKKRMAERLPLLTQMKDQGLIGENNLGYLEFRSGDRTDKQKDVVGKENADRLLVYHMVAEEINVSVQVVGKRRAVQIAKNEPEGHWIQKPDGSWVRKTDSDE
ncbi:MAG: YdbL family protein [Candidatus Aminicenantes bacterium]|nr:YdbL family protein [Candidatus Aminicenantes bacterium]